MLAAVRYFGPTFTVKGGWEGTLEDLKSLPAGLEPSSVGGMAFSSGNVEFTLEDGSMGLAYGDGPLSFKMDDGSDWAANYTKDAIALRLTGNGAGSVAWEAAKSGSVSGLGDVDLSVNSDGELEVGLTPSLPAVKGLSLNAHTLSNGDGIAGSLEASSSTKDVDINYAVENSAGAYDLASLKHLVKLAAKVGGGDATAAYTYDDEGHNYNASFKAAVGPGDASATYSDGAGGRAYDVAYTAGVGGGDASLVYSDGADGQSYNASFSRGLKDLIGSASDLDFGVDDDGIYGALSVSRDLSDIAATVDLSGRVGTDGNNPSYAEALTLAHKLGSVTVSSGDDGEVDVTGAFDVDQAGNKLHADVGYSLSAKEPTYNVTFSRSLADLVKSDADVEFGVDGEGAYGSVSASKDLGSGFSVDYSSSGRADSLDHRVKVHNDLGYAELTKSQDGEPRVSLGYEFDM